MKYHFRIHEEEGFWAECIELEGCMTQAETIAELCENMYEALNLFIEEPEGSQALVPLPDPSIKTSRGVVEVGVDPRVAFAFLVRSNRLQRGLTQQEMAARMGFDQVYSYQRLENKCNPSLTTITKIKEVFPDFSIDFAISP